jgi:RNA polymerase sigma-70 factor (ECF subfamily)
MNKKQQILQQYYKENWGSLVKGAGGPFDTPQDGEDVVQEAFTRALTYIDTFNPDKGNFEGWFRRILQNTMKDHLREKRLKGMSDSEEELEDEVSLDNDALCSEVAKEINNKRQPARDILTMYFLLGYTPKDISKSLNLKSKTVRQAIWRFKNK